MDFIELLGAEGSRNGAACIRITEHAVIGAGNLLVPLGRESAAVRQILLTHACMDHVCDLPFLIERYAADWDAPLTIYGTQSTLRFLERHIFNDIIWPDFRNVPLKDSSLPCLTFAEVKPDRPLMLEDLTITPVANNHMEGSCGFLLKKEAHGILISGDTYLCESMTERVNRDDEIRTFCVNVSFPSYHEASARSGRHLTPELLQKMLRNLRRRDLDIYAVWCKFPFHEAVAAELEVLKLPAAQLRVASDTERIPFVPTIPRRSHSPRRFSANPLREISDASLAISSERDIDRLLEMILTKVQALTRSDGGILYLLNKEEKTLEFKAVQYLSLGIRMGGADGEPILWEPLPLYTPEGQPGTHMAAAAFFENRVINIPDIYHAEDYDFLETKNFDEQTGYRSQSMLILPLRNHENILVGILQLINKKTEEGEVVSYGATDEDIAIILAMQAATVLTKQQFIDDMETLFESFLHSIIIAIENKSRYTAGHIQKMVAVTSMLVDAVNSDETLFPDTYFDTEEKKQIILAAMMHDVGKIVIPEYIIDKATRLQTLFDRIELVRLRAEIRRKEALIDVLAGRGKSKRSIAKKDPYYCDRLAEIDRDLSLIEHLNTATEPIREEEIARLKKAARAPIVLNDTPTPWLSDDEVENLCIRQGTLTSMERKIINNHAYVGMKMLQKVKFPKKYARIPKIASAHHEKLDGSGYPLGLAGKEICLEARILAVADIFEALTAADRPYKKPETAEGAMVILEQMARKGELDPKIVSLLRSGGLYGKIDREILSHDSLDT